MKSKEKVIEQWERINSKYSYFLEEKRKNFLHPKGSNQRYVEIAKDKVVREIDSEFVYTVYGKHQEGMFIMAVMDDLNHDIKHFEQTFSELQEQVNIYLKGKNEDKD